jgi:hypothetical protein
MLEIEVDAERIEGEQNSPLQIVAPGSAHTFLDCNGHLGHVIGPSPQGVDLLVPCQFGTIAHMLGRPEHGAWIEKGQLLIDGQATGTPAINKKHSRLISVPEIPGVFVSTTTDLVAIVHTHIPQSAVGLWPKAGRRAYR